MRQYMNGLQKQMADNQESNHGYLQALQQQMRDERDKIVVGLREEIE